MCAQTRIPLEGKIFGKLIVISYVGNKKYLCKCECGNEKIIRKMHLVTAPSDKSKGF